MSNESEPSARIGIDEIMRLIPHRPPFLLVDAAEDYIANTSIVGIKCMTVGEPFFAGHFPAYPVVPGVLLVEAIAQSGGILMSKSLNVQTEGKTIYFMSLDNCRFRSPVRPGDVVRMPVQVTRSRGPVFKFRGEAMVNGKIAAECEFAAMVADIPA